MVRRRYREDGEMTATVPGRNLYRLVAVSFGLLCILQAALNVSLRLTLYRSQEKTSDAEAICKNVTKERDELKRKMTIFDRSQENTSDAEAICKNVTKERDELKRKMSIFDRSQENTSDAEAICKNVTKERDELKRKMTIFVEDSHQGWVHVNNSFYYISTLKKSWQGSRIDCLGRHADLMIINSKEEAEFTRDLQEHTWIGLTDLEREGKWKWVDGTPLTISFWGTNEPNSHGGTDEDCVEIKRLNGENSWNDVPCEAQNNWICEKTVAV